MAHTGAPSWSCPFFGFVHMHEDTCVTGPEGPVCGLFPAALPHLPAWSAFLHQRVTAREGPFIKTLLWLVFNHPGAGRGRPRPGVVCAAAQAGGSGLSLLSRWRPGVWVSQWALSLFFCFLSLACPRSCGQLRCAGVAPARSPASACLPRDWSDGSQLGNHVDTLVETELKAVVHRCCVTVPDRPAPSVWAGPPRFRRPRVRSYVSCPRPGWGVRVCR